MPPGLRIPLAVGKVLPLFVDPNTPSAELILGRERPRKAEHHPQVSIRVELAAEGILVIVTVDSPAIGHRFKQIRAPIAREIGHARDLAALRGVEMIVPSR